MKNPTIDELMNDFYSELGREDLIAVMKQFTPEKSIEDMFRILWDLDEAHKYIRVTLVENKKSEAEATRLRELGDVFLLENNLTKALEMYNLGLMAAPHPPVDIYVDYVIGSRSLAMPANTVCSGGEFSSLYQCYASRSEVLYKLEHYDLCLRDIELTRDCTDLENKLDDRKKECLRKLQISDTKTTHVKFSKGDNSPVIPEIVDASATMPSFSSACKVTYTPEKGRHIIAHSQIRPGDVLLVEKAYCTNIYQENYFTHCVVCLRDCLAPLPCPSCTKAVFCSVSCIREGLSGFHKLECPVLSTLYTMDMMPVFGEAYKLLGTSTCKQWKLLQQHLEERARNCLPEERGRNKEGIYNTQDVDSVFNLCPNAEERPCGDLYTKCFIAFVLTKILQLSGRFFVNEAGLPIPPSDDDLIFAGRLLFTNVMKVSSNIVSISSFQCTGPPFRLVQKDIGAGMYPSIGLVNHSCDPSALPQSFGHYYVLRAARTLQPGDEITIGYSRGSYLQPIDERQQGLYDRYQFECECEACEKEWPVYEELPLTFNLRCPICSQPVNEGARMCPICFLKFSSDINNKEERLLQNQWKTSLEEVKSATESLQSVVNVMTKRLSSRPTKQDFNIIRNATETLWKHIAPPARILWDVRDALDMYFHLEKNTASNLISV